MRTLITAIVVIVAVFLSGALCGVVWSNSRYKPDIETKQQSIDELEKQLGTAQERIDRVSGGLQNAVRIVETSADRFTAIVKKTSG